MEAMVEVIESKRAHLREYPASCAARIGREDAFDDLYDIAAETGMSKAEVDRRYRKFEDYVFAELTYGESKTCCWNSTTHAMYELAIQYNRERLRDEHNDQCGAIDVFMAKDDGGDGFERFREYAESVGRGEDWVDWSADESCPQAGVAEDTRASHAWTPYCEVEEDLSP